MHCSGDLSFAKSLKKLMYMHTHRHSHTHNPILLFLFILTPTASLLGEADIMHQCVYDVLVLSV